VGGTGAAFDRMTLQHPAGGNINAIILRLFTICGDIIYAWLWVYTKIHFIYPNTPMRKLFCLRINILVLYWAMGRTLKYNIPKMLQHQACNRLWNVCLHVYNEGDSFEGKCKSFVTFQGSVWILYGMVIIADPLEKSSGNANAVIIYYNFVLSLENLLPL